MPVVEGFLKICQPTNQPTNQRSEMKKLYFLAMVSAVLFSSGCVQTMYNKSIAITKDADGNILQIVETESVTQPAKVGLLSLKL